MKSKDHLSKTMCYVVYLLSCLTGLTKIHGMENINEIEEQKALKIKL